MQCQNDWRLLDASVYWDKGVDDNKKASIKAEITDDRISGKYAFMGREGSAEAWIFRNGVGAKVKKEQGQTLNAKTTVYSMTYFCVLTAEPWV